MISYGKDFESKRKTRISTLVSGITGFFLNSVIISVGIKQKEKAKAKVSFGKGN